MDNLKELLSSYKEITSELLECLSNADYGGLDALLSRRGEIVDSIKVLDYTREEFADACKSLDIMRLEKNLNSMMKERLEDTKKELKKAASGRNINNAYNRSYSVEPLYFNKKI
jgi:hypothetical protein